MAYMKFSKEFAKEIVVTSAIAGATLLPGPANAQEPTPTFSVDLPFNTNTNYFTLVLTENSRQQQEPTPTHRIPYYPIRLPNQTRYFPQLSNR